MKCPACGHWNKAAFPRCFQCGAALPTQDQRETPEWQTQLRDAQPEEVFIQYEEGTQVGKAHLEAQDVLSGESLGEEMEHLKERRMRGAAQLANLRTAARQTQERLANAPIVRPVSEDEDEDDAPPRPRLRRVDEPQEPLSQRKRRRERQYVDAVFGQIPKPGPAAPKPPREVVTDRRSSYDGPEEPTFIYADDDPEAPVLYDDYTAPQPRLVASRSTSAYDPLAGQSEKTATTVSRHRAVSSPYPVRRKAAKPRKPYRRVMAGWLKPLSWAMAFVVVALGAYLGANWLISATGQRPSTTVQTNAAVVEPYEADGISGHIVRIEGTEGTQIYIKELEKSYVVTGGTAEIAIPDHFWFDNRDDIYTDTLDVTLTPFIRYNAGEQKAMTPVTYTIPVPLSPVRLLRPDSQYAEVFTSRYEIKLQVERGSRVIIDGTNVSEMIDSNGRVSKNVQVQPIGENRIQISVRSNYCRENNLEITLYRKPQDIPLELAANTSSETDAGRLEIHATTLEGATVTIETPYENLVTDQLAINGAFSFVALLSKIGDNVVVIRASYPGMPDSVINHTINYIPKLDAYSRKAWPMDSANYTELVNNIPLRNGQVYKCLGTIQTIISEQPQVAIMMIEGIDKPVLLENSSKTIWEQGTWYRIYADAYTLYDKMPRMVARFTYKTP